MLTKAFFSLLYPQNDSLSGVCIFFFSFMNCVTALRQRSIRNSSFSVLYLVVVLLRSPGVLSLLPLFPPENDGEGVLYAPRSQATSHEIFSSSTLHSARTKAVKTFFLPPPRQLIFAKVDDAAVQVRKKGQKSLWLRLFIFILYLKMRERYISKENPKEEFSPLCLLDTLSSSSGRIK
jgi:hypothetical protein